MIYFSSLAEAKEQLFPSMQASASVTSISSLSWKTSKDNTIFGPMCGIACFFLSGAISLLSRYKIQEPTQGPNGVNEFVL
jgi:hypothetical protein